ncbi:GMP synthase [glutamine-hydrolyzing] subunit A [Candidatus Bilamarchaeum dharawalense]|uniref:Imidazole glycerol phosphate synthase subunit HisH n=1 Tax=Candidatus Bilamarchaeum dharawalense TaxID=2885759 RepID=A0A5E4LWT2_9ARCH|nr:GMP synthase [glutamine-hydrolyzing] subunit A [Candidatus Bilamarchaeum dharawalense]
MPKISILNLGIGNINSVKVALTNLNAEVKVVDNASELSSSDALVLPGVGNFNHVMNYLRSNGYLESLYSIVIDQQTPFLGICLGMQLLAVEGEEGGVTPGLGWIKGRVVKLKGPSPFHIPHMGWDDIHIIQKEPLLSKLPTTPSFYFVHSYYFESDPSFVTATCDYGFNFPVSVQKNNIFGVQFHPEKSQKNGLTVLSNFLNYIKH